MTIESALQLPVIEKMGDRDVRFARLDMTDLATLAVEIRNESVAKGRALVTADRALAQDAPARFAALQRIESERVSLSQVLQLAEQPAGITKLLRLSLKKAGECKSDGDADAILRGIHYGRQYSLAVEVLSAPAPEAGPTPLDLDTNATGSPSSSTSDSSVESPSPES